jgi:two-component system, response regulator PdtaR
MARLRVVLVEDGTFAPGSLRGPLDALDVDVVAEGSDWSALVDQADARSAELFVLALGNDPGIAYDMAPRDRAVVVVTDTLSDVSAAPAVERGAFGFLPYPLDAALFHAQARAAVARASELARARRDAADVRDQLETRKLVERAKGILMDRLGLSEHDAFRKLQKASQDENRKMGDIAESVIRAEKMFGAQPEPEQEPAREHVHIRGARSAS